jgi:CRISPR-associated protein Cas6
MANLAPVYVDAALPLRGKSLPLDHGYPLFGALSRVLPVLHERTTWGVHPVRGVRSGVDVLALDKSSLLKLRLPAEELGLILPLAGQPLDVAGHRVTAGVPQIYPLVPAATLRARYVNVKKFFKDEQVEEFRNALRRQIAAIEGLGQDPERVGVEVEKHVRKGKEEWVRRVMVIDGQKIVGFAVTLTGLEAAASIAIQRVGLGGRRHMGGGIFVPPGRRG